MTAADPGCPLFGLVLTTGDVRLRPAREADLGRLADLQPDDFEHDPRADPLPGEDVAALRRRLVHQEHWRALGTWTPQSWRLDLVVELGGEPVGVQSLEAEGFDRVRTVETGSWNVPAVRGRGVGVAMRRAVLALAFDHLEALAAVTSARPDNAASLGVSRRLGYRDNGVSLNASGSGLVELHHMRLRAEEWRAAAHPPVTVTGLEPCLPWFGVTG